MNEQSISIWEVSLPHTFEWSLLHYFTVNFVMIKITFDRSITTGSTHTHTTFFSIKRKRIHHVFFDILSHSLSLTSHTIKRRLSNLSKMILKCFVIWSRGHNVNSKQRDRSDCLMKKKSFHSKSINHRAWWIQKKNKTIF